jgi:ribosome-associated protein
MQRSLNMALAAAQGAEENRGEDILILDLREQTPIFDYFVIATGVSQRQLRAMADAIDHILQKEMGQKKLSVDGYEQSKWIALDFGPVVVQLFDPESRKYYQLEELWGAAPRVSRPAKAQVNE